MKSLLKIILPLILLSILISACSSETPTPIIIVVTATPPPTATHAKIEIPTIAAISQEPNQADQPFSLPPGAISWDDAISHIGETITVCGPVVDSFYGSSIGGQPTFLNIGKPYPEPERFTILIWGDDRSRFPSAPDIYYLGKTICATGEVILYKGSAEMKVTSPSQITIP